MNMIAYNISGGLRWTEHVARMRTQETRPDTAWKVVTWKTEKKMGE